MSLRIRIREGIDRAALEFALSLRCRIEPIGEHELRVHTDAARVSDILTEFGIKPAAAGGDDPLPPPIEDDDELPPPPDDPPALSRRPVVLDEAALAHKHEADKASRRAAYAYERDAPDDLIARGRFREWLRDEKKALAEGRKPHRTALEMWDLTYEGEPPQGLEPAL